ncbi:MAG: pantoate--beta-alanine ligase [Cyclobacteriaceae bacterium]|nr:pantoate--beta-alanine ligase [Cyclobacteriaceae bacterium]
MHIFKEIAPLRDHLKSLRSGQSSIGFVPTMGALHKGHLGLINASKNHNDITVCSIYVNPTQFGNPEDLAKYPRTLEQDIDLLEQASCDVLFCPSNTVMYHRAEPLTISFDKLDRILEGEFRPGHFSGVAVVVSKLFNIVQPDIAYFGQKDYQQVMIISKLIEAMKFNVQLHVVPTVREHDGLALSSRNQRLSVDERNRATVLYQGLRATQQGLIQGLPLSELRTRVAALCDSKGVRMEYLEVVDQDTFEVKESPTRAVILIAAYVGNVRLIDNLVVESQDEIA